MPSKQTQNYKLSQWARSDKVLMEDFNADNAAIDAAIKAVDNRLTTVAGGKADASALESLKQTVTGHTSALSGKGNCTIHTQSYVGTGAYGSGSPNKLTFPARPKIVFIMDRFREGRALTVIYGQTYAFSQAITPVTNLITWNGNTMSWYCDTNSVAQLNQENTNYDVVALIAES